MPFISKDWRSPGETWIKTKEGWEKKKVLENCKRIKLMEAELSDDETPETAIQPHCHITIKSTKEIAGFNELTEVLKKLDFMSAVRDVRRFNYICALLGLLIGQQMTALSGCVQKVLLSMLEEVASHAIENHHNPRNIRLLLGNLKSLSNAERAACWGGLLGSQMLWSENTMKIERILNMAANMQICELSPNSFPQLLHLPEECIREIILRLADHKDLTSVSDTCPQMAVIVSEQRIWKELCKFHFSQTQIELFLPEDCAKIDWKKVYHSLKKYYFLSQELYHLSVRSVGLNEDRQYAEMLSLCRYCKCLFWKSLGHPCIADQCPEFRARIQEAGGISPPSPVPPSAFLKFFSL